MRCSSKSIHSSSSGQTILAGLLVLLWMGTAVGASDHTQRVEQAIADAVRAQIGESAEVRVTLGLVRLPETELRALEARPVSGARLARPTRFTLYRRSADRSQSAERVGYAVAEVHATFEHLRTVHPVSRGTVLTAEDVMQTVADVGMVALATLPTLDDVVGATMSRPLKANELVE